MDDERFFNAMFVFVGLVSIEFLVFVCWRVLEHFKIV